MRRFAWSERQFILDVATAVKWAMEAKIESGVPFAQAKVDCIKKAEPTWKHLDRDTRQAILNVVWSIAPPDLSKRTHKAVKDRMLTDIEKHRGWKAGPIERVWFALTGMVFRV